MSATTSAVVTGAARGFGREIARRLVARGHRVLITDLDADLVTLSACQSGLVTIRATAASSAAFSSAGISDLVITPRQFTSSTS